MSKIMLPKFQIRNLRAVDQQAIPQGSGGPFVRVNGPAEYDQTIINNPEAVLRYQDEDHDTITVGSSAELVDKLGEPVPQTKGKSSRKSKNRMSIAMLLSEAQHNPESLKHHAFDIDEREEIQKLWQEIQRGNKTPPPSIPTYGEQTDITADEENVKVQHPKEGIKCQGVSENLDGRGEKGHQMVHQLRCDSTDDEKRSQLASAYDRLKSQLWTPIAAEIGIPWQEAEDLHWSLGKAEITRRAEKWRRSNPSPSEDLLSVRSTDGDWHENRNPKCQSASVNQRLSDYRAYHFKTTMPPTAQFGISTGEPSAGFNLSAASSTANWIQEGTSSNHSPSPANLTVEGKRKAQAAGDILRARTTPSRHRKAGMGAKDNTSHENRWAEYKSPNSAFSPKTTKAPPQGFVVHTLTSEGKRQAQAAGDKLRCRTNPIRHSRPSRSGSLEAVGKNRWSSYMSSRINRFDECHHATEESKGSLPRQTTKTNGLNKQPSLLQVFEAELAKSMIDSEDGATGSCCPDPDISTILPKADSTATTNSLGNRSALSVQQPNVLVDGFKIISNHLQGITKGSGEDPQDLSNFIDQGVRTAAVGLEALMQGFTGSFQGVADRTQKAADMTHEVDTQNIDQTISGLRDFVVKFAAGLNAPRETVAPQEPPKKETKASASNSGNEEQIPFSESSADKVALAEALSMTAPPSGLSTDSSSPREQEAISRFRHTPRQDLQANHGPSIRPKGNLGRPRYHKPGPIHLPHRIASSEPNPDEVLGNPSTRPGYVEHLRQYHSPDNEDESPTISPQPAATRFPTLAQFEGGDFKAATSFPALPSMEPLVPQRAGSKSEAAAAGKHPQIKSGSADTRHMNSGQQISVAPQTMLDRGQSSDYTFDTQSASLQQQHPAAQEKLSQVRGQHLAKSSREYPFVDLPALPGLKEVRNPSWDGTHDSAIKPRLLDQKNEESRAATRQKLAMALRLFEQQDRKRWLLARQQWDADSDELKLPGAFPKEQAHNESRADATSAATLGNGDQSHERGSASPSRPQSAARLAGPFDPSEVEPSARPHLTEGIRRNATVAGTNSRQNALRRRPYSEAYDGLGRSPWNSFIGVNQQEDHDMPRRMGTKEQQRQAHDSVTSHQRQEQPRRSTTLYHASRSVKRDTVEQEIDPAVRECVDRLRECGYSNDRWSEDRLLVYAQAANGVVFDAVDIIEEEQRVYNERL